MKSFVCTIPVWVGGSITCSLIIEFKDTHTHTRNSVFQCVVTSLISIYAQKKSLSSPLLSVEMALPTLLFVCHFFFQSESSGFRK